MNQTHSTLTNYYSLVNGKTLILVSAASKGLGCYITEHISVRELHVVEVKGVFLKGVPFMGLRGSFAVNFHIPIYRGIGKSASRGLVQSRGKALRVTAQGLQRIKNLTDLKERTRILYPLYSQSAVVFPDVPHSVYI